MNSETLSPASGDKVELPIPSINAGGKDEKVNKEVPKKQIQTLAKCQSYFQCDILKILIQTLDASMRRMQKGVKYTERHIVPKLTVIGKCKDCNYLNDKYAVGYKLAVYACSNCLSRHIAYKNKQIDECYENLCAYCVKKSDKEDLKFKEKENQKKTVQNVDAGRFELACRSSAPTTKDLIGNNNHYRRYIRIKTSPTLNKDTFYFLFTELNVELLTSFRTFTNYFLNNSYQIDPVFTNIIERR
uniref:Nuclear receptor domain-containing protein n=1 Tax=Rhabditophanes sp. KR3021 TaxID=114890 RepID=A0AC35U4B2_9BILA